MNTPDPIACLLAASDAVMNGDVPEGVKRWFADGVRRYLGGGIGLDQALNLKTSGWSAPTRHAYAKRDEHLRRACDLLGGDTHALADEITRFELRTWPRWKHLGTVPDMAAPVQVELFAAFATQVRIPSSPRHLARICTQ